MAGAGGHRKKKGVERPEKPWDVRRQRAVVSRRFHIGRGDFCWFGAGRQGGWRFLFLARLKEINQNAGEGNGIRFESNLIRQLGGSNRT